MGKIKVEEPKESAKETGEENEEEKDRIKKQKAREVKDAAASAKENEEEKDKIKKQKAREVTDATASAKTDEENDEITKQKAREVTDAAASAKKDMKHKAREVTDANASAKKDSEEADNIAKPKEGKVVGESEANENDENDPSENEDVDKKSKSLEKERAVKMAEKPLEEENGVDEGNEVEEDSKVSKKKSKSKGKELKDDGNAKANQPGIFAMKSPRKEKYDHKVDANESESKKGLLTEKDLEEQTAAVNKCAKKQDNKFEESKIEESKVDNPMQKPKFEGKTVREPIASKPLRKIPTESNATNEKSNDSTEDNLKESKVDAADKAGKMEKIPIVSKLLRKCPVKNEDPKAIAEKEEGNDEEEETAKAARTEDDEESTVYKLMKKHGSKFDEAINNLNEAKGLLTGHLQLLKPDTFNARVGKIDELELLLPEIAPTDLRGAVKLKPDIDFKAVSAVPVKPREGIGVHKASAIKHPANKFPKGTILAADDEKFPNVNKLLEDIARIMRSQETLPNGIRHTFSPCNGENYVCFSYSTFKKLDCTSVVIRRDAFRWRRFLKPSVGFEGGSGLDLSQRWAIVGLVSNCVGAAGEACTVVESRWRDSRLNLAVAATQRRTSGQ